MSDTPVAEQAAQRESLVTRNWVLGGAVALLFLIVQSLLTWNINSTMTEAAKFRDDLAKTNQTLTEVLTTQKVQQVESQASEKRLSATEKKIDDLELRLNTAERRQAITDAYMSGHK